MYIYIYVFLVRPKDMGPPGVCEISSYMPGIFTEHPNPEGPVNSTAMEVGLRNQV